MKKLLLLSILAMNCHAAVTATTTVNPHEAYGYIGKPFSLIADHHVYVLNDTDEVKKVKICFQLCAENKGCADNNCRMITFIPHAAWEKNYRSIFNVTYYRAAHFILTASTIVEGVNQQTGTAGIHI